MNSSKVAVVIVLVSAGCGTPSKADLDAEVKRLCEMDGGIRVYETVVLPPDKFNERGGINFFRPTQKENALGPDYVYMWTQRYVYGQETAVPYSNDIVLRRSHVQIARKADGKLLGEMVMYNRSGGDWPGPWVQSSYYCPDPREVGEATLMRRVFTKR